MLYIIYTDRSLDELNQFLANYGDLIGPSRVMYHRGEPTNRVAILLSPDIYRKLIEDGYGRPSHQFRIVPYNLRGYEFPVGSNRSLFLSLSKDRNLASHRQAINEVLMAAVAVGLIDTDSYQLNIPVQSRTSGTHRGIGFIHFDRTVPIEAICYIRAFLNGYEQIRCFWAKDQSKAT